MSKNHSSKKRLKSAERKQWNKDWKKEWEKGVVIGELNASRAMILDIMGVRFPALIEMTRRRVQKIHSPVVLRQLVKQIVVAPDEKTALHALMFDAV